MFLAVLVAVPLLAALGLKLGVVDHRPESVLERKPRQAPVPPVGGWALGIGLLFVYSTGGGQGLPFLALAAAGVLGTVDDLKPEGLKVWQKLLGQALVALVLGWELGASVLDGVLLALVAMVAMNAANTFDCADGACSLLGLVALAGRSALAPGLLAFLPYNLFLRRGTERVPLAYLGDSGSHMVGVALAAEPAAWPLLALPVLDLLRLSWVRTRAGGRPWHGDRRHLAHRLERAGLGALSTAAVLGTILLAGRWLAGGLVIPVLGTLWFAALLATHRSASIR